MFKTVQQRVLLHQLLSIITIVLAATIERPVPYYYCGRKTFADTPISVSRDEKFVTDMTGESMQNLTTDPGSFIVDVTGCVTPIGELKDAVGIELKFKNLPNVYNGAVQNLRLLQMLKMEFCKINEIEMGAFLELPSIQSIYLRYNRIEKIDRGIFNNLKVTKLFLSNNSINFIDSGAFDDMPNLAVIELDSNKLKNWNTDWFTNTPNVEQISLDSNQLTGLPANAFKKLRNYYSTSIRLSNNQIIFIHPTAFEGLNLLYALWLDYNNINDLDEKLFLHFERIYILSLIGNKLTCLSEELLYNMKSQDIILRVEDNKAMSCQCLQDIEKWAKTRNYFFTERYAKNECSKKKERKLMTCTVQ